MKRIFTSILLCLLARGLQAQDLNSLKLSWVVTQLNDVKTQKAASYNCVFETNGKQNIFWKQGGGNYTVTMLVTNVSGFWPDVKTVGKVEYEISIDGERGTLTFERATSGVFITLDSPGSGIHHTYSVSQVNSFN